MGQLILGSPQIRKGQQDDKTDLPKQDRGKRVERNSKAGEGQTLDISEARAEK